MMRAFNNLAVLDPPSAKGGGYNMTIAGMSRRITNFIKVTPHSIGNVINHEESNVDSSDDP